MNIHPGENRKTRKKIRRSARETPGSYPDTNTVYKHVRTLIERQPGTDRHPQRQEEKRKHAEERRAPERAGGRPSAERREGARRRRRRRAQRKRARAALRRRKAEEELIEFELKEGQMTRERRSRQDIRDIFFIVLPSREE
jgi:hypothetical protein